MTVDSSEESRVPDRYQIPCGDCSLTEFRDGSRLQQIAIGSVWSIIAGAVICTVFAVSHMAGFVSLRHWLFLSGALLLGVGYGGMFGVVAVNTAIQAVKDIYGYYSRGTPQ